MKELSILFVALTLSFPSQKCSNFRNGKYVSALAKDINIDVSIERENDLQIEIINSKELQNKCYYKVEWTSDCSYNLYLQSFTGKSAIKIGDTVSNSIENILSEKTYVVKVHYKDMTYYDTLTKL